MLRAADLPADALEYAVVWRMLREGPQLHSSRPLKPGIETIPNQCEYVATIFAEFTIARYRKMLNHELANASNVQIHFDALAVLFFKRSLQDSRKSVASTARTGREELQEVLEAPLLPAATVRAYPPLRGNPVQEVRCVNHMITRFACS